MSNPFRLLAFFSCCVPLFSLSLHAEDPITIATWNVGLIDRSVADLALSEFEDEVDADILVLNEVKTSDDVQAIRAGLEREEDFFAISSFANGSGNLEVAILSRFPISDVVEFDRSPESNQINPEQEELEQVSIPGIANVGVGRGFLVVRVPSLNTFVIATHLKSSRGRSGASDHSNAQKRELVAAAIADHVNHLIEEHPDATVFVAGDMNVGVSDANKNGTDLTEDKFSGSGDKYDETHALLTNGLVDDLKMISLGKDLLGTFVGNDNIPDFPGSGAIDAIYVVGADASNFKPAKRASDRFGSDHLAVFSSTGAGPDPGPGPTPTPTQIRIKKLLPNPNGQDAGNETITLENTGSPVTVSGWKFRDAAGHSFAIPAGTEVGNGFTVIPLTENTMPLTNKGDTIILLNAQGAEVGPAFSYSKGDVSPGQEIVH